MTFHLFDGGQSKTFSDAEKESARIRKTEIYCVHVLDSSVAVNLTCLLAITDLAVVCRECIVTQSMSSHETVNLWPLLHHLRSTDGKENSAPAHDGSPLCIK